MYLAVMFSFHLLSIKCDSETEELCHYNVTPTVDIEFLNIFSFNC